MGAHPLHNGTFDSLGKRVGENKVQDATVTEAPVEEKRDDSPKNDPKDW